MRPLLELLPQLLWALSVAAQVYVTLEHALNPRKEPVMSEPLSQPESLAADAPIATSSAALPDPTHAAAQFAAHPVTQAVVQGVYANSAVPPHNAASVAASVLNALMPLVQPAEQISRASPKTSAEIAIGFAALEAILAVFFPHPNAA